MIVNGFENDKKMFGKMCVPDSVDSCDSSVLTVTVTVSPFAPIFVQIDCDRVSRSMFM